MAQDLQDAELETDATADFARLPLGFWRLYAARSDVPIQDLLALAATCSTMRNVLDDDDLGRQRLAAAAPADVAAQLGGPSNAPLRFAQFVFLPHVTAGHDGGGGRDDGRDAALPDAGSMFGLEDDDSDLDEEEASYYSDGTARMDDDDGDDGDGGVGRDGYDEHEGPESEASQLGLFRRLGLLLGRPQRVASMTNRSPDADDSQTPNAVGSMYDGRNADGSAEPNMPGTSADARVQRAARTARVSGCDAFDTQGVVVRRLPHVHTWMLLREAGSGMWVRKEVAEQLGLGRPEGYWRLLEVLLTRLRVPASLLDVCWLNGYYLRLEEAPDSWAGTVVQLDNVCWLTLEGCAFHGVRPGDYELVWRMQVTRNGHLSQAHPVVLTAEFLPAAVAGGATAAVGDPGPATAASGTAPVTLLNTTLPHHDARGQLTPLWLHLTERRRGEWFDVVAGRLRVPARGGVRVCFHSEQPYSCRGLRWDYVELRACGPPPSEPRNQ